MKAEKEPSKLKKSSKRSKTRYPALNPEFNLKSRQDLLEADYIDDLSEAEKAWLNKFNEEYVNANLDTEHPRRNLHKTKALRSDCYRRNNLRNKDLFTKFKAHGDLDALSHDVDSEQPMTETLEDTINRVQQRIEMEAFEDRVEEEKIVKKKPKKKLKKVL